jgi:tetratricopeptide (TPR) repeat protein
MLGHPEQALPFLEQALRLDPMPPDVHTRYGLMGQALLVLGHNEEAVEWLRRAVQAFPPPQTLYRDFLAAALARAGRRDGAQDELRRALDRWPCMTVSWVRHRTDFPSAGVYRNALADGLALAGLRDNAGVDGSVAPAPGRCDRTIRQLTGVARLTTDELHRMIAGEKPQGNRLNKQEARFRTEVSEIQATKGHRETKCTTSSEALSTFSVALGGFAFSVTSV